MFDIFVSYRRDDSRADAGRLYDRLAGHFGDAHVFMDIDDIEAGQDFVQVLTDTLDQCGVLIAIIGPHWLDADEYDGRPRLHDPADFVRLELERALERGIQIVPVLVAGAVMAPAVKLPGTLRGFARRQAFTVTDERFHDDVDRLINALQAMGAANPPAQRASARKTLAWSGAAAGLVLALTGVFWGADFFQQHPQPLAASDVHVQSADQFLQQGNLRAAAEEYERALALEPDNVPAMRNLVRAARAQLELMAFGPGGGASIALRRDYQRFVPVPVAEVDRALAWVYRLHALRPELKDDVDLMLDEALLLKATGPRVAATLPVLDRLLALAPDHARALAERGVIKAVVLSDPTGVEDLRRAVALESNVARYHLYLARALDTANSCSVTDSDQGQTQAGQCVASSQAYRKAAELAVGDDIWSAQIRRIAERER